MKKRCNVCWETGLFCSDQMRKLNTKGGCGGHRSNISMHALAPSHNKGWVILLWAMCFYADIPETQRLPFYESPSEKTKCKGDTTLLSFPQCCLYTTSMACQSCEHGSPRNILLPAFVWKLYVRSRCLFFSHCIEVKAFNAWNCNEEDRMGELVLWK